MRYAARALLVVILVSLVGCISRTYLPVAPNVLRDGSGSRQLEELPPTEQRPDMRIFYITDRVPERAGGRLVYGHERSSQISYGEATVSLGRDATWKGVVKYSTKGESDQYLMRVTKVEEIGTVMSMADLLQAVNGKVKLSNPQLKENQEAEARQHLEEELAKTPYKDVYIYVHGYNNSFDDSVMRLAGVWHYLGRRGVAIAYSWPAGIGGPLGYFYDRESGEFTVFHLKRALKIIAGCKSVERIHIIAHSRGTDVVTSALRELNIEYSAKGLDAQKELKLWTLVLAAPDLDRDVFRQRFAAENLMGVSRQFVIYCSSGDFALAVADWLFGSSTRLGQVEASSFSAEDRAMLKQLPQVQVVVCEVNGYSTSHAYVFSNPAALSDLVLVLRDGTAAGEANGRPLGYDNGIWYLGDKYFAGKK
jgi:esterase/lipase superfamily enzyme